MNRLIIIGNAFDLANSFKTSYADFLLFYLKKAFKECDVHNKYNDELINIVKHDNYTGIQNPDFTA